MKNTLAKFLFCIVLAMVFAHVSFADNTTAAAPGAGGGWSSSAPLPSLPASPNPPANAAQNQFGAQVNAALSAMHTSGAAMATALVSTGETLLYLFYAITLAWYVYEGMASQQLDVLFKKWISHTMIALIALEMLWGWSGTDTTGIGITNFLITGMNVLGDKFITATGGIAGSNPADNIIDAYNPAIQELINIVFMGSAKMTNDMATCGIDALCEISVFFNEIATYAVAAGFALLSAGLLAIAMIYALFYANLGDFIIYVGLAVGPIFVATLVFPAAQGFFSKWLEFMISGGMYKLIAVVVGTLLGQILLVIGTSTTAMVNDSATLWLNGNTLTAFILTCFLLMFWSLFAYFITKQTPHFVTALSGGANIHLNSMSSLAPSPPGSMPKFGKPKKGDSSETAEIKAATAIRTAEIKAASAASTAATKAASKANSDATKAAIAVNKASIKAANDLEKLKLKQSGHKVVRSGSSDGVKAKGEKPSSAE
ncbi:MAG: hypothetical protein ACYC3O_08135 [Burkholderiales bacterium]